MKRAGRASSRALAGCAELIAELGGDALLVARAAGIPPAALEDREIPLPGENVILFYELAAASCNARDFGLRMARRQGLQVLGPLWVLMRSAGTIRDGLNDLSLNFELVTSATRVRLDPFADGLAITYEALTGVGSGVTQTIESGLALLTLNMRLSMGPQWNPQAVQFRHARPIDSRPHRAMFGEFVLFDQDRNALHIDQAACDAPISNADVRTHDFLTRVVRTLPGESRTGEAVRVELAVRALLLHAPFDIQAIAHELGTTARTLQRRLKEEGVSFQGILDRVRLDLAQTYLRESNRPAAEIAELLRFADSTVLTRFIRAQTGDTPSALRRTLGRIG